LKSGTFLREIKMTTRFKLAVAGLGLASSLALAQTPYTEDSTYQGLGGKDGIKKIVDSFLTLVLADPRIKDNFADFDIPQINQRLQEQFCEYAGGPCKYNGKYHDKAMEGVGPVRDMKSVHQDLKISDKMFNALAEDLQIAMEQNNVPTRYSNKLIAKLAPMHGDIVTARDPAPTMPEMGKFIATGGVSQLEGAGGGGITPWALITGYGSRDGWGANAHYTYVNTQDYSLDTYGIAVGIEDRLELSFAQQEFKGHLAPLNQLRIKQNILGLKYKLAGNAVYDQDSWMPQIAIGAMYKRNQGIGGLGALGITNVKQLGAKDDTGYDYYISATKILFEQSLLVNGTLRATRANQMGILGFGGDQGDSSRLMPEASVAYLFTRKIAGGVEYRRKPHNLGVDHEKDYYDAFVAWFPNRNVSVTLAYAELGDITIFNPAKQHGVYISLQAGF
jgi:truncated hemoglobin YjbI